MTLCGWKKRQPHQQHYLTCERVELIFELPFIEIVFSDFYDRLKSVSRGYASLTITRLSTGLTVKMDIRLNENR